MSKLKERIWVNIWERRNDGKKWTKFVHNVGDNNENKSNFVSISWIEQYVSTINSIEKYLNIISKIFNNYD